MAGTKLLEWRGFGPRGQAVRAMAIAFLCIAAWASSACAEMGFNGVPSSEYFIAAGATQGDPVGLRSNRPWVTIHGGAAHRITNSIAVGLASGWSFMGTRDVIYVLPGGGFLNGRESFSMIPTMGYVKVRLPMGSHGGVPYVMAGAGPYTLLARTTTAGLGNANNTRLGFSAAIGLSSATGKFSPQLEARYDSRSTGPRGLVIGSQSRLNTFTVSLGVQLH